MIRNFSASIVDEEAIKDHFQEMIERNSALKMDVQRVKEKRRRRRILSLDSQQKAARAPAFEVLSSTDSLSSAGISSDMDIGVHIDEGKGKEKASDHEELPVQDQKSYGHQRATDEEEGLWVKKKEHESTDDDEAGSQHENKPTVIAVHVAWEVRDVLGALEIYQDIYEQLNHYRHEKIMRGRRPLVWFPPLSSLGEKLVYLVCHFRTIAEGIIYGDGRGQLDAIRELKRRKAEQSKEVERTKERAKAARGTGVVFVTFSSSVSAKVIVNAYQKYACFWKPSYWLSKDLTPRSRYIVLHHHPTLLGLW